MSYISVVRRRAWALLAVELSICEEAFLRSFGNASAYDTVSFKAEVAWRARKVFLLPHELFYECLFLGAINWVAPMLNLWPFALFRVLVRSRHSLCMADNGAREGLIPLHGKAELRCTFELIEIFRHVVALNAPTLMHDWNERWRLRIASTR